MPEILFYIAGGVLVVTALVVAFAGMRNDDFPSSGVLRGLVGLVAVIVLVTAVGAVLTARDEAEKRSEEQSSEAATAELSSAAAAQQGEQFSGAGQAAGGGGDTPTDAESGQQLFIDSGCGDCHTLGAAGSDGAIGPNLDESLADEDEGFIEKSIVDPSANVEEGFGDGIMPNTYSQELTEQQLKSLAEYIDGAVHSG